MEALLLGTFLNLYMPIYKQETSHTPETASFWTYRQAKSKLQPQRELSPIQGQIITTRNLDTYNTGKLKTKQIYLH